MNEAMFYEKLDNKKVKCNLCNHLCIIAESKKGICGVRENKDGILYSLVFDKIVAKHVDPIEKKPLFHFFPASNIFSIATVGCNFRCLNCQNYDISQRPRERLCLDGEKTTPEEIVFLAKQYNCQSIAYTYTEPTVFYELAYETAKLSHRQGIKNVFVSNGYMTAEAAHKISPYLDGINIDLKSFSNDFYQRICGAKLEPVLETIKLMKELGVWIEVTTLIIPTYNDSENELRQIAEFIYNVGQGIPWHVTQFYPTYKLTDQPRTPIKILRKAREIGLGVGLRYVYEGNVPGEGGENTYCYECKKLLIKRFGYQILENNVKDGKCVYCDAEIDGVWRVRLKC